MSKAFCSKTCKENYFDLIAIQIPKPFVKRIYIFCNEYEREEEIIKFAKLHNWKLDLLKSKIKKVAAKMGYEDDPSVRNSIVESCYED